MTAPHVVVVGAGALGGWTALECVRRGARVTLIDAWTPGHSRSSSGGDTRILRHGYGPEGIYVGLVQRSLQVWRRAPELLNSRLFDEVGVLWLVQEDESFEAQSVEQLHRAGVPFERLEPDALARRWPQIDFTGIRWGFFEPHAGALYARRACQLVAHAVQNSGGTLLRGQALPFEASAGPFDGVRLASGERIDADRYVFAGGPWMKELFPQTLGSLLEVTRQEVFSFGVPPGESRFDAGALPVWADHSDHFWYGIPGNDGRGFKLGRDTLGPPIDPTFDERQPSPEELAAARAYLAQRFPALAGAPLLESRVCQYTVTSDRHPILTPHPTYKNVALAAGGSGHAFKLGPALGSDLADWAMEDREFDSFFSLDRF